MYVECGLNGFERFWRSFWSISVGAGTVKARLGLHPTHPHSLGMEVSQASRLVCVYVCVCVLGCGWGAYPHTSRGGRNVAALRSVALRSVPHGSAKVRIR